MLMSKLKIILHVCIVCVCIFVASRAKMMAVKSISKLRGQTNHTLYPQPEGMLGECMAKYGKELGEDSLYGMMYTIYGCGHWRASMKGLKGSDIWVESESKCCRIPTVFFANLKSSGFTD